MSQVSETIRAQHRDFARVLKALEALVSGPLEQRRGDDLSALFDIIHYARVFPDKLHHPDEERYVFGPLREVAPEHAELLDTVRAEHDRADSLTTRLHDAVHEFDREQTSADALRASVRNYLDFQFEHMRKEEEEILPLVDELLDADVHTAAGRAFAQHADPLFGENLAVGFDTLRRRIESHVQG